MVALSYKTGIYRAKGQHAAQILVIISSLPLFYSTGDLVGILQTSLGQIDDAGR